MEDKKLTICFLGNAQSIHTLKWVNFFSKKGHNVHLISYDSLLEGYNLGNIKLYFLKKKIPIEMWPFNTLINMPFNLLKVKKIIKEVKPDIIHAHYVTSYGTLASLLKFYPLVITAWGSDILVTPKKFLPSKWAIKYALSKADLITCDAEHMKEVMIKLEANPSKIKIINFGIDTKQFSPDPKDGELKKERGTTREKIVISLRIFVPHCDVGTLIRAIPLVLEECHETRFIIVGNGPQENELKMLARELNVFGNVKFIGFIPNEELPDYLRSADVCVSTSLSDGGIAASTAEAMSCGLPVVITDVADNKKWVRNGENGFVIPIKNPEILAEKIIYLLKDENLCKKMGQENRKVIEEKNDYYKEMAKMEEIYCELVNKPRL